MGREEEIPRVGSLWVEACRPDKFWMVIEFKVSEDEEGWFDIGLLGPGEVTYVGWTLRLWYSNMERVEKGWRQ